MTASNNAPRLGMLSMCTCPATPLKRGFFPMIHNLVDQTISMQKAKKLHDALHSGSMNSSSKKHETFVA